MTRLFKSSEAKRLELPGRVSLQPISGETGSRITLRCFCEGFTPEQNLLLKSCIRP